MNQGGGKLAEASKSAPAELAPRHDALKQGHTETDWCQGGMMKIAVLLADAFQDSEYFLPKYELQATCCRLGARYW